MRDLITLPNGKTYTYEEFSALPEKEQQRIMQEVELASKREWGIDAQACELPSGKELLPRIRAAAERNAIKEEDLLAFIKVVHDVFFPPQPKAVPGSSGDLPGKLHRPYTKGAFVELSKPVITPAGEFPSMASAGRYYQVEGSRIRSWVKTKKPGFYYKDDQ